MTSLQRKTANKMATIQTQMPRQSDVIKLYNSEEERVGVSLHRLFARVAEDITFYDLTNDATVQAIHRLPFSD